MLNRNYIYAVSAIIGTSIGVGIFSLPFVASKSGFGLFLLLVIILGFINIILALMYGEVTLRTTKNGRLVGYCEKYLGKGGKRLATIITLFSLYASMLAYIIIGGKFLNIVFAPFFQGSEFIYSIIMALVISIGIYISLRLVSIIELLMVIFLFFTVIGIILKGSFFVDVDNLLTYNISQTFFPFGAILFSIGALSAIPTLEHIMKRNQKKIRTAIISGNVITIIVYILFTAVVLGITGSNTSDEALLGLNLAIGNGIVILGVIFGIFAIATSFLMIGINLKEIFWYDYHFSEKKAWAFACFVPLLFFILGVRDFITVVSIAGSIAGGFVGIFIIIIFYKAKKMGDLKPAYEIRVSKSLSAFMILVFVLGIIYQFIY